MAQTYYSKILNMFDWEGIRSDCEADLQEDPDWPGGQLIGRCYLGSVLDLTPSGKFYMPWANSNVTKREADRDEAWYIALDAVAAKYGLYIETGEGDPCDLFAAMVQTVEAEDDPT